MLRHSWFLAPEASGNMVLLCVAGGMGGRTVFCPQGPASELFHQPQGCARQLGAELGSKAGQGRALGQWGLDQGAHCLSGEHTQTVQHILCGLGARSTFSKEQWDRDSEVKGGPGSRNPCSFGSSESCPLYPPCSAEASSPGRGSLLSHS